MQTLTLAGPFDAQSIVWYLTSEGWSAAWYRVHATGGVQCRVMTDAPQDTIDAALDFVLGKGQ